MELWWRRSFLLKRIPGILHCLAPIEGVNHSEYMVIHYAGAAHREYFCFMALDLCFIASYNLLQPPPMHQIIPVPRAIKNDWCSVPKDGLLFLASAFRKAGFISVSLESQQNQTILMKASIMNAGALAANHKAVANRPFFPRGDVTVLFIENGRWRGLEGCFYGSSYFL